MIDEKDLNLATEIGVEMVSNGEANFIIKGLVYTFILLKAVLNKEWGLRTESLLSSPEIKGYKSKVAGGADVLLVPNTEMDNRIRKSITYFAKGKSAGVIMGSKAPIY